MKKNKSLILLLIITFNFLFSSFASANDDLDSILENLNSSKTKLEGSTKASKQAAININNLITLITTAKKNPGSDCSDSLNLASTKFSSNISMISSRTCKSNKKVLNNCIPKSISNEIKTELKDSLEQLNNLLEVDDDSDGEIDICEASTTISSPSPSPSASASATPRPTSTPSSTPEQEIGTCSINQKVPSIDDLPIDAKSDFTNNLGFVEIHRYLDSNGTIFKIKNTTLTPIEMMIELKPNFVNITPTIPEVISIGAASSKTAFKICPSNTSSTWNYSGYTYSSKLGSSSSVHTGDGKYILPFRSGESYKVIQGETGTFSHFDDNLYSIDFGMPEGSTVVAMRDGTVLSIKEDSNEHGTDKEIYASKANYVWIIHEDNSFGYYLHLKQNGALVEPGTKVKAGDVIGLSGNTGYSTGPHLHAQVVLPKGFSGTETIPIRFKGINGALEEGSFYTAN